MIHDYWPVLDSVCVALVEDDENETGSTFDVIPGTVVEEVSLEIEVLDNEVEVSVVKTTVVNYCFGTQKTYIHRSFRKVKLWHYKAYKLNEIMDPHLL